MKFRLGAKVAECTLKSITGAMGANGLASSNVISVTLVNGVPAVALALLASGVVSVSAESPFRAASANASRSLAFS